MPSIPELLAKEAKRAEYLSLINSSIHMLIDSPHESWVLMKDNDDCWLDVSDSNCLKQAMHIISYMLKQDIEVFLGFTLNKAPVCGSSNDIVLYTLKKN